MRLRIGLFFLLVSALPCAALAQTRSVHWDSLDVVARLDASGRLEITERHAMVFDGPLNGGERIFRLGPGQELELLSVRRLDGGVARPLAAGSPSSLALDEYALFDGRTLRWRSRRPSDPPFRNQRIAYEITYALTGVVFREGEAFTLDHDFAFPEREGAIGSFSLDLEIDPAWGPEEPLSMPVSSGPLKPGESYIVTLRMSRLGDGSMPFVHDHFPGEKLNQEWPPVGSAALKTPPATLPWRLGSLGVVLGITWLAWRRFGRRERELGRYEPLPEISRSWLDLNLFKHRPEVVGAAWDGGIGRAEVAALIAVMTSEGKIVREDGPALQLRLAVPRESLPDYERTFIEKFFPQGDVTSPKILKAAYQSSGFDPAAAIRSSLAEASQALVGAGGSLVTLVAWIVGVAIVAWMFGGLLTVMISLLFGPSAAVMGSLVLIASVATFALASVHRARVAPPKPPVYLLAPGIVVAVAATTVASVGALVFFMVAALLILLLGFRRARPMRTAEQLANLRGFHAARNYFRELLERNDPRIEAFWTPYLIAFDLAEELDRWSVASPGGTESIRRTGSPLSSSSPPLPSTAFRARGGGFGGAGATGGWAAVTAMASSIASPASSTGSSSGGSRSSGGGGGRSSSGGGGGGGW
jgi:hypothetical protein